MDLPGEIKKILKTISPTTSKNRKTNALFPLLLVLIAIAIYYSDPQLLEYIADQSEVKSVQDSNRLYKVERIVDGDTIKVEDVGTIRLIGIDTPEVVDPRKPVECFGREASEHAKKLLSGKNVRLEYDSSQDKVDKYGRTLAYIFTQDGTFFNREMIKQGYAHEYTYSAPYKYQNEFKLAQKEAESNKRGLWGDTCNSQ